MKLHFHETKKNGRLFRALTRDKAGKILNSLLIGSEDSRIEFRRSDWKYKGTRSIDFRDSSSHIQQIRNAIKKESLFIGEIEKIGQEIHVFDVEFDLFNVRIYSLDEDLERFKKSQEVTELTPNGEFLGYDNVKLAGSLKDMFSSEIAEMGINIEVLMERGWVGVPQKQVAYTESLRRFIQRSMRKEIGSIDEELGIITHSVDVHSVKFVDNDKIFDESTSEAKKLNSQSDANKINIENNPNINISIDHIKNQQPKKGRFRIVVFIGLIGSIFTIISYFGLHVEDIENMLREYLDQN